LVKKLKIQIVTVLLMTAVFGSLFFSVALAGDRPFNNASNWGGTGLLEMPNARVLEDGTIRLGVAQADPYRWYAGAMGVLPRVEFGGRFTELLNRQINDQYGNDRDKAFDVKFQVVREGKYLPAIAIGVNDFHGTRQFPSEYITFSRQFYPLDITFGFGTKRFSGGRNAFGIEDFGPFGGIEWNINSRFNMMAEYSPIEYEKDKWLAVDEKVKSPINVGMRAEIFRGVDLGLSWQRGDTLGVMLHFNVKLGKSVLPKKPNPPAWRTLEPKAFTEEDALQQINAIKDEIEKAGFDNIRIYLTGKVLTVEYQNDRYISNQKAVGRGLRILLKHAPPDIERIAVVLTRRKMAFLRVSVPPDIFDQYLMGGMRQDIFDQLVSIQTVSDKTSKGQPLSAQSDKDTRLDYQWGIKPEFETFFNDLSGAFRYRVGIKPFARVYPWKGAELAGAYMIPFYSNVTSVKTPPPDAVRSDAWKYLGNEHHLDRLYLDQTFRLGEETFARLSAGYFEKMYAGTGGEILTFPGKGSFAFGVESDWVKKRVPGSTLAVYDDKDYYTVFGNLYYRFKPLKITMRAQYGRFLGADVGWRFEARREYSNGLVIGAWYTFTDTDHFLTEDNRGYNDKGIFMRLPAQMFSIRETRTRYHYSLTPWTRDVGAMVDHPSELYETGADLMPALFEEEMRKLRN